MLCDPYFCLFASFTAQRYKKNLTYARIPPQKNAKRVDFHPKNQKSTLKPPQKVTNKSNGKSNGEVTCKVTGKTLQKTQQKTQQKNATEKLDNIQVNGRCDPNEIWG